MTGKKKKKHRHGLKGIDNKHIAISAQICVTCNHSFSNQFARWSDNKMNEGNREGNLLVALGYCVQYVTLTQPRGSGGNV